MNTRDAINCLLEKDLISQDEANALLPYVTVFPHDMAALLAYATRGGTPSSMATRTTDDTTPIGFEPSLLDKVTRIVATAHDDDVYFVVTATGNALDPELRHSMTKDVNYTFSPTEWRNFKFVAATGTATISATYYK